MTVRHRSRDRPIQNLESSMTIGITEIERLSVILIQFPMLLRKTSNYLTVLARFIASPVTQPVDGTNASSLILLHI